MMFELVGRNQIKVESRLHCTDIYMKIIVKQNLDLTVQT